MVARSLALSAAILLLAPPADADPIKYALANATFGDGGQATGYVVYELPPAPGAPQVTDWAITVIGGTTGISRFAYDPTNSTLNIVFNPGGSPNVMSFTGPAYTSAACGGTPRRIQFDLLHFGALAGETCGTTTRHFASGDFQRVPGPVLTLKINGQHPASRVDFGGGSVWLTLDISPAGWTTPLDWYWAIKFEQSLFWVTPGGLSTAPAPFAHAAPTLVSDALLLFTLLPGNTRTTFAILAIDGSIISADSMTELVPSSP